MVWPGPIPRSRLRLAAAYLAVIGLILYGAGYGLFGLLMRSNWSALESEVETLAGTLHDSLKPLLPAEARPLPSSPPSSQASAWWSSPARSPPRCCHVMPSASRIRSASICGCSIDVAL